MIHIFKIVLLLTLLCGFNETTNSDDDFSDFPETDLQNLSNRIRSKSSPDVRPVARITDAVNVTLKPTLYQILEVDEVNQAIKLSIWMDQQWDDRLTIWNPDHYSGIDRLRIAPDAIWKPDTYMFKSLVTNDNDVNRYINVLLVTNKTERVTMVTMRNPSIIVSTCSFVVHEFPFDTQHCVLEYGSWTHVMTEIDYNPSELNSTLPYYIEHSEWQVLAFYSENVVAKYDCCPDNFSSVFYHLVIQRKPLYYIINLVVPAVCLSIVNFLGFFGASSSSGERQEKISLAVTTLLAMGVLLLQLTEHTPKTSMEFPLIGIYLLIVTLLITLGALMTAIIIYLQHSATKGLVPPRWMESYVIMRNKYTKRKLSTTSTETEPLVNGTGAQSPGQNKLVPASDNTTADPVVLEYLQKLKEITKDIQKKIHESRNVKTLDKYDVNIWEILADDLERGCLVLFLLMTVGVNVYFFTVGFTKQAEVYNDYRH